MNEENTMNPEEHKEETCSVCEAKPEGEVCEGHAPKSEDAASDSADTQSE